MRGTGTVVAALLLLAAVAAAQEAAREFQVRPLGFSVAVPAGWTAGQGATGMTARDAAGNGFVVTREPFLHDPETFATAWVTLLRDAKLDAKVERTKAAGRDAWRAAWTAGDRQIEVWRVHVCDGEMLYNFSFSGAAGFDMKTIVEPTLKSFKCVPSKAEMKFQRTTETVSTRIQIRLPEDYAKDTASEGRSRFREFTKGLPGYDPPRHAGRIRLLGLPVGIFDLPGGGSVNTGDAEATLEVFWAEAQGDFASCGKKSRPKDATFDGIKGTMMEVPVLGKDGLPLRWMAFCGKFKQDAALVVVIVDDREARLHKDYLKQVCSHLEVAK
jgi:hypothetical protein